MSENVDSSKLFDERRKTVVERRIGVHPYDGPEKRSGMERRKGPGIRRSEERKAAEEGYMTPEQFDFLKAIDSYKRQNNRPFPSWTEVLEVVKALGYRKVEEPQPIDAFREKPVAAAK